MLYEDDEIYSQLSSDRQNLDDSTLGMAITSPGGA